MYPSMPFSGFRAAAAGQRGPIDTDERRAVTKALTDALYAYLILPTIEMERSIQIQSEGSTMTIDRIVQAQEQVDKVRESLEEGRQKVETAMEGLRSAPEEMQAIARIQLRALYVDGREDQLKSMEEWLSGMQSELEKGETAV